MLSTLSKSLSATYVALPVDNQTWARWMGEDILPPSVQIPRDDNALGGWEIRAENEHCIEWTFAGKEMFGDFF